MKQNKQIKVYCSICSNETNHIILETVNEFKDYPNYDIWESNYYQIIKCRGCDEVCFLLEQYNSEDLVDPLDGGGLTPEVFKTIFPVRIKGVRLMDNFYLLPAKIRDIYHQTYNSICSEYNIIAGIGIRATIEAVCKELKCKGKNLEVRIDKLVTLGHITKSNSDILHKLRFLGNNSAHEIRTYDTKSLIIALNIVEHLLKEIYIIPRFAREIED